MARKKYCVRVVHIADQFGKNDYVPDVFIECMRYAGLITPHDTDRYIDHEGNDWDKQVFDIESPSGVDSKIWSEQNAARMQSFGYNAVSAPSTRNA